ncbi:MAG: response regulator [Rhodocyclaceae bacterium]|nr:HD domain-containing protein [Dechloromonas sp.]TEX49699.1 MAG: response regulator [Rhodocyclaceae bacterium]
MGAVHTLKTIHRSILLRLLSVWLLLTPLAVGLGYWIEVRKFEEDLVALVSQHLESVSAGVQDDDVGDKTRYRATREFVSRNYLFMRIIDETGKVVAEGDNPVHEALTGKLRAQFAPLPQDGRRHVSRLEIDGVTILRVAVNLPAGLSGRKRSLEGAFIIDAQELQQQRDRLRRFLGAIVLVSLATTLALYPVILSLNRNVLRASREILQGNIETAAVLGAAIAKRDSDTGEHNYRVTLYAIALAEKVGLEREQIRYLTLGAFLHDVGKIGIPDAILLKPGRLDETEFATMKQHVGLGLEIIANSRWLAPAAEVIGNHHEKVDGSGYPQGRRGEDIPLNARIFAIVDVFDALMSKRPYKPPMALEQALEILRAGRGQHFDSALVDAFCDIADERYRALCDLSETALSKILVAHVSRHYL